MNEMFSFAFSIENRRRKVSFFVTTWYLDKQGAHPPPTSHTDTLIQLFSQLRDAPILPLTQSLCPLAHLLADGRVLTTHVSIVAASATVTSGLRIADLDTDSK